MKLEEKYRADDKKKVMIQEKSKNEIKRIKPNSISQLLEKCPPSLDSLNLPPPVMHTECLTRNSCQRGYICRLNRCVNGRALASKTVELVDDESSENLLEMVQCCTDNYLPDRCIGFCSFESYNESSIFRLFSDPNRCPMSSLRTIHFCASQNMDHRDCCEEVR